MKALLAKLRRNSQSAHDDPTRNSGGRSWEQGTIRAELHSTLVLTGSSQGETEPRKATHRKAGAIQKGNLPRLG
ncbi:hypothetical protein [Leptolyngbya sp. Cla-17]|uniref:hypothetical protein n=1 Tax=Leptolyngbya sp. Cla-17 TaxID=2803751 RepID=UPI001F5D1255|nr:hypothetical protein [Leptolyngbya sp. Cla-17]